MMPNTNNAIIDAFPRNNTELVCIGVSNYQAKGLVFVRLFAKSSEGEPLPTRFGISLPFDKRQELVAAVRALGDMMSHDGEVARIRKSDTEEIRVGINPLRGRTVIDLRTWTAKGTGGEYVATADGITLNLDFLSLLLQAMDRLSAAAATAPQALRPSIEASPHESTPRLQGTLQGVKVTQLSPEVATDLYIDESGFLIHPHLLEADEPRKSRDERWGTVTFARRVLSKREASREGNVFQRIAAGANSMRVGGGRPRRPDVLPVTKGPRDIRHGLLKCPLCEHQTEYSIMFDHIVVCHATRNAKLVMAEFNRKLRENGGRG